MEGTNEVEELFRRGVEATQSGDNHLARQCFQRVLDLDPTHERAWLWLADVVDTLDEVVACYRACLEVNPANEAAQWGLKDALERQAQIAQELTRELGTTPGGAVTRLGQYLVAQGWISPKQLQQALAEQRRLSVFGKKKRLGQLLVEMRFITQDQLNQALEAQRGDFFSRFQD